MAAPTARMELREKEKCIDPAGRRVRCALRALGVWYGRGQSGFNCRLA